jgi:hypothetical protein
VNIVPSSISYWASVQVQYDTLQGTIFTNIHAITLLLYSNTYFFCRSVINTVEIWFFHLSLLYCTRKNILIFALVQYEWHSERTGIFSGTYKDVRNIFLYFTVGLDRLYKIWKKYRCVPNVIHIALVEILKYLVFYCWSRTSL